MSESHIDSAGVDAERNDVGRPQTDQSTRPHHPGFLFLTGICMGSADVVPGVSGGTMALIMGIYQDLLGAIRSVNLSLIRRLLSGDFRCLLTEIPWRFLIPLGLGIVGAVLSLAELLEYLLHNYEQLLFAFFFGLVAASIASLGRRQRWTPENVVVGIAGVAFAFWLVGLVPISPVHTPLILFGSGAIAICAMILPGISGSFILLILGQYRHCVEAISASVDAIKSLDVSALMQTMLGTVIPFGLGAAAGLMLFARVLSWLLRHYHELTISVLLGFMLGSLRRLWPFKDYLKFGVDRHGDPIPLAWKNRLPIPGEDPWLQALGLAAVGFAVIFLIERLSNRSDEAITP